MKSTANFFLIFLFAHCFSTASAQLNKGGFFIDGSFNPAISLQERQERKGGEFDGGFLINKMIGKRIMMGGGISSITETTPLIYQSSSNPLPADYFKQLSLFFNVRWYFGTKKWAPFGLLQLDIDHRQGKNLEYFPYSNDINHSSLQFETGLGLDFFMSKSIVLETLLSATLSHQSKEEGEPSELNSEDFSLQTNFRIFFDGRKQENLKPLKNQLLRTGSILLDGSLQCRIRAHQDLPVFYLNQTTTYFVGNRTSVNAQLAYARFNNQNQTNHTALGVQQYFDLTNALLCSIKGQIKTKSVRIVNEDDFNATYTELPFTFQLHYFKKRRQYFMGAEYSFIALSILSTSKEKIKAQHFNTFLGMDYYLIKNVLLQQKLTLNWQTLAVPYTSNLPRLNTNIDKLKYSFGLVFLI